jgi:hypothetical protein
VLKPAPEVKLPPPQPVNVEPSRLQQRPKSKNIWIWGLLLLVAIITGSFFAVRSFGQTPMPTSTFTPTLTSTSTSTSTPTLYPTYTPLPTATQLTWVTEFAQPILDAIASRSPSFQDDFHNKSGGWQAEDWCGQRMEYVQEELVITDCRTERAITSPDFVIEIDWRFLPGAPANHKVGIGFKCAGCEIRMDNNGSIYIIVFGEMKFNAIVGTPYGPNHVLVIAKGDRYAFFVNNQPFYYMVDTLYRPDNISLSAMPVGSDSPGTPVVAAFDNIKIWYISDLP